MPCCRDRTGGRARRGRWWGRVAGRAPSASAARRGAHQTASVPLSGPKAGDLFAAATRRDSTRARAALRTRLEERRVEMEGALLTRLYGVADPTEVGDLAYLEGLRTATSAALDFGLATIEASQDRLPLVPPALLAQARLAARSGVGLDTVLRRYTAGHALLVDFLVEEVERGGALSAADLRRLLAVISAAIDRLLVAISEEHARELESRPDFSEERRLADRVERLLAGEPIDATELSYELGNWHVGVVAQGSDVDRRIRSVAKELSLQVLVASHPDGLTRGWLGARRRPDLGEISLLLSRPQALAAGVGEAGEGLVGWRFTHRQAAAAFSAMPSGHSLPVRYADVALLASADRDELLSASLRMLFLAPLDAERDGGKVARETLRAYFQAEGSVSSAAAILGVKRHTVTKRLRSIEERLGRPLARFSAEMDVALRLEARESTPTRT